MKIDVHYVDSLIDKYINEQFCSLNEQMQYSLSSGGKRIRPTLLLKTAQAVSEIDQNIERLAVALECIHTYSLIHDDLPAMDNDDYRRGKLTSHKKYGEAIAILTGDCLLNLSMEIVTRSNNLTQEYFDAIRYLFKCSGGQGMIYGQVLDIDANNNTMDSIDMVDINKTGRLLQASIVLPLIYFGKSEEVIQLAESIGELLGKAYQLADDLLDGKQDDSTSYLSIMSVEQAKSVLVEWTEDLTTKCDQLAQMLGCNLDFLVELIKFNSKRQK